MPIAAHPGSYDTSGPCAAAVGVLSYLRKSRPLGVNSLLLEFFALVTNVDCPGMTIVLNSFIYIK